MNIKIQSISDVITNSSTEAFIVINYRDLQTIKDLVNAILKINTDFNFDDLFDAKFIVTEYALENILYDWDSYESFFKEVSKPDSIEELNKLIDTLSEKDLNDLAESFDNSQWDSCIRFFSNIEVKAKKTGNAVHEAAALAISNISYIFDVDYCYE